MTVLIVLLAALVAVLYLAIAAVLLRRYLGSREIGFAWLGMAVVVWPLLSRLLQLLIGRLGSGPFATRGEFLVTLTYAREIVGLVLLFVAVFSLSKTSQPTVRSA